MFFFQDQELSDNELQAVAEQEFSTQGWRGGAGWGSWGCEEGGKWTNEKGTLCTVVIEYYTVYIRY